MSFFELDPAPVRPERQPLALSDVNQLLTAQIMVAWAGEGGEERRLGWWRSDLCSEFGGEDLFKRLLPHTWKWATLQGAREAARRRDAELRAQDHDPDRILSLFSLGFELDERVEERLLDLKRSVSAPVDALPALKEWLAHPWSADRFLDWVRSHGETENTPAPIGRRLKGSPPGAVGDLVRKLVGGLAPLGDSYPLPHWKRSA